MAAPIPRIGVGVFLLSPAHPSSILMGTRLSSLGAGTLALPGGHLEFGESFEECAAREVKEETDLDLDVRGVRFLTAVNSVFEGDGEGKDEEERKGKEGDGRKHYVTIFMVGKVEGGREPKLMEPGKCAGWGWVGWEEMRGWAIGELERREMGGGVEGNGSVPEGDGVLEPSLKPKPKHKLFLPLLNLVGERPDVAPLRLE